MRSRYIFNDFDVVAIPIALPAGVEVHQIESINTTPDLRLAVTSNVFVLGYPEGISGGRALPIWKRASIASEPGRDLSGLPMMFVWESPAVLAL
jgi:hypothetical protein